MNRWICGALLAGLVLLLPAAGHSATVVKLATLVPDGSIWDRALHTMGSEWRRDSAGRVSLRIYPGGVAGDDADVVRKMRIGQLHAGALTVTGLAEISPAFKVFAVPLFFDSYEELFHVAERLEPLLIEELADRGFVFLGWGHAGWVHFFSKKPIESVDDLRSQKIFSWAGDDEMVRWWKENGFQPVALAATDIMTGLQSGMIDALATTPLAALGLQWFRQTPYMHGLGLGPFIGATVMTERAWSKIPEADRTAIRAAARRVEERLETEIPEQDDKAVAEMRSRGLEVTGDDADGRWRQLAERFAGSMRGRMVPVDIFDRALAEREAFRRRGELEGTNP